MELAGITQNVNSTVPLTPQNEQNQLNRVQKNESAVLHKDKDAAIVSLSQSLDNKKSGIFENISMVNNAFAITQIAQKGLDKQEDILNKMKNVLEIDTADKSVDVKKSELISLVKDFNNSIRETKFNNEMVLSSEKSFNEITISTKDDAFFVQTPDMQKSMENIAKLVVGYDGSEDTNKKLFQELSNALDNVEDYSSAYSTLQDTISKNPMEKFLPDLDATNFTSNTFFIDYGKEMADFSKSNITAQFGYLAAAQANILQEHSSKLLV
jgi:flagellin-like hook-associated protein FlgL